MNADTGRPLDRLGRVRQVATNLFSTLYLLIVNNSADLFYVLPTYEYRSFILHCYRAHCWTKERQSVSQKKELPDRHPVSPKR
jgi:hypothetical protein